MNLELRAAWHNPERIAELPRRLFVLGEDCISKLSAGASGERLKSAESVSPNIECVHCRVAQTRDVAVANRGGGI